MSNQDERVRQAIAYIEKYVGSIRGLEEIAQAMNISYPTLRQLFRWQTGKPLGQYVTEVRIQRAKQLLGTTNWKCCVIAQKTGFSSETAFERTFRRITGITPTTYRMQCRKV